MTDKEFKRLSRPQLIEIIYQYQLKLEELTAENERLSKELADKRLRIDDAGNIAEAALSIHNVLAAAQDAAAHYIDEIQLRVDSEYARLVAEANEKAAQILKNAQQEAAEILGQAKKQTPTTIPPLRQFSRNTGMTDKVR